MSRKQASAGMSDLSAILSYIISKNQDIRVISINLPDGSELYAETKTEGNVDDSALISSLVPSFSASIEKSALLGLGKASYSLLWSGNIIILQYSVESLILSITMEESANISLIEENLVILKTILQPFASFDPSSDAT